MTVYDDIYTTDQAKCFCLGVEDCGVAVKVLNGRRVISGFDAN